MKCYTFILAFWIFKSLAELETIYFFMNKILETRNVLISVLMSIFQVSQTKNIVCITEQSTEETRKMFLNQCVGLP